MIQLHFTPTSTVLIMRLAQGSVRVSVTLMDVSFNHSLGGVADGQRNLSINGIGQQLNSLNLKGNAYGVNDRLASRDISYGNLNRKGSVSLNQEIIRGEGLEISCLRFFN